MLKKLVVCLVIESLIFGRLIIIHAIQLIKGLRRKRKCTQEIKCQCIGHHTKWIRRGRQGFMGYAPIWSYEYNGTRIYQSERYKRRGECPEAGETSTIMVNPGNDEECYKKEEYRLFYHVIIIAASILCFCIAVTPIIVSMWFTWKIGT